MSDANRISRVQELVYDLKVESVMSAPAIAVTPETRMVDLRGVLKSNRISGVPVLRGAALAGIISVEDFINWLAQGAPESTVGDHMAREVVTAFAEDPLIHVVSALEKHGYGRLPVLRRSTGDLVGIITKGDVIEGLLREMEIGFHAEEIQHYRASHLFEDILADAITLTVRYHIGHKDVLRGGEVSSKLKISLRRLGIRPESVRRAAIATYEAEMNVIIYAEEGDVTVHVNPRWIRIDITDKGPGIPDVKKAMEPGYSTAPEWVRKLGFGAGMGLANISRCAETFRITSRVGEGTDLSLTIPMEKE